MITEQLRQVEFALFELVEKMESQQLNSEELRVLLAIRQAFELIRGARKDWTN